MQSWDLRMLLGLYSLAPLGTAIAERAMIQLREHLFRQLSKEPERFRDELRAAAGVIAGSGVVRVLEANPREPKPWRPRRYDIFVPRASYNSFSYFLENQCEGTVTTRVLFPDDSGMHVSERRTIKTPIATFSLFCATGTCPLTPIAASPLDIQFSFWSADTLCIAYPWAVYFKLAARRPPLTSPDTPPRLSDASAETYLRRGYTFRDADASQHGRCIQHGMCPKLNRHFGDRYCVTLTFGDSCQTRSTSVPSQDDMFMTAAWTLGGPPCGNPTCAYKIHPTVHSCMISASVPLF